MDIDSLRREYTRGGLKRADLQSEPLAQFQYWLKQAIDAGLDDPTAMTVATVDVRGQPSQRLVLLKQVDERGFVFYTNFESRKARELEENPRVSLHFPWHRLERQVKIRGIANKVPASESLAYFTSRPRESQLAAWASEQSRPVSSRQMLMQQFDAIKRKFANGAIPLPDRWGGLRVVPEQIEFWQGGEHRLHDRFEYTRNGEQWDIARLAP